MKALQVQNRYRVSGGTEVVVDATTNLLRKRGVEVFLLTQHSRGLEVSLAGKVRAFICGIYSPRAYSCLARFIRRQRPDVVHVHNLCPLFSPSVLVACRRAVGYTRRCLFFIAPKIFGQNRFFASIEFRKERTRG